MSSSPEEPEVSAAVLVKLFLNREPMYLQHMAEIKKRLISLSKRILIVAFTWVLGEFVLVNLYGEEYKAGFYALIIFTAATAVESYRTQVDQVLMSLSKEKSVALWETAKLLVIAVAIFILFDQFPLLSAPIAVLVASLLTTLGRIFSNRSSETFFAGGVAISAGLGLVALLIVCYFLKEFYIVLPTAIVLIVVFRVISVSDLKVLLKMGPQK